MKIINGNNIDVLKQYPDNYFDSIVTDPPYGLGKEPNAADLMKDWIEHGYHEVGGSGFMGKEWDAFVPQPIFWKEVFRVLKHGGHVLAFYGTRTYDWGVMSMRFAGFEVRDCIQWLYGSGFPKSHNISKALDKMEGAEREVIGKAEHLNKGNAFNKEKGWNDNNLKSPDEVMITAPATESAKQWDGWGTALKPANEPIVLARKPLEKGLSIAENILKWGVGGINIDASRIGTNDDLNGGQYRGENNKINDGHTIFTDTSKTKGEFKQPQGRFPANIILTHHEDCVCKGTKKVKGSNSKPQDIGKGRDGDFTNGIYGAKQSKVATSHTDIEGNEEVEDWDCHEDCPIRILDEQSGILKSGAIIKEYVVKNKSNSLGKFNVWTSRNKASQGGASRYFMNFSYGGSDVFFTYIYNQINQNICGNTLENQKVVGTLNGVIKEVEQYFQSVGQFINGNKSMENYQMDTKYTISTLTKVMIELKTYNALQGLNIDFYMEGLLKTINSLMELKIGDVNVAKNINQLKNLLLEIVELIKVTANHVKEINYENGKKKIEKDTISTIENIEKSNHRFQYQAKASKAERNKGLDEFEEKEPQHDFGTKLGVKREDRIHTLKQNFHPTVKPIKLMQYLVRMITPPNGIVLDPFVGSGTTGIACKLEGFDFVGIEQDPEYTKIAEARINNLPIENKGIEDKKPKFIQPTLF